jgi:hypothetical protein
LKPSEPRLGRRDAIDEVQKLFAMKLMLETRRCGNRN